MREVLLLVIMFAAGALYGTVLGCCMALKRGPAFAAGFVEGFCYPWRAVRQWWKS